jgi:hypothetical protein
MESMKPTWLVQDDSFIDESKSTVMRANENDSKGICKKKPDSECF